MRDELGGKIMNESVGLRAKTYSSLMNDAREIKKNKGIKKCVIKTKLRHQNCKTCVLDNGLILSLQQRLESEAHNLYTQEVNKIALSSNDDKRLQTYDKITSYPYGTSAGKLCKTEILCKVK